MSLKPKTKAVISYFMTMFILYMSFNNERWFFRILGGIAIFSIILMSVLSFEYWGIKNKKKE